MQLCLDLFPIYSKVELLLCWVLKDGVDPLQGLKLGLGLLEECICFLKRISNYINDASQFHCTLSESRLTESH